MLNPVTGALELINLPKAGTTQDGYLSQTDWNIFNSKLDASRGNYISNPSAEVDTSDWNLYNDAGRTVAARVVNQDLTFTSVATGDSGNGIVVDYIFHASQSSSTPLVTVVSPTRITVAWYNGPTLANNPTATQLKAAWDAVAGAVALVTCAISGTAGNRQYIVGAKTLSGGGDTSPVDGSGGSVAGLSFSRTLVTPLIDSASFHLIKDANSREGSGISIDFQINAIDRSAYLQLSFAYLASSGMTLGTSSDVRAFIYDVTNSVMIPLSLNTLAAPTGTPKTFVAKFLTDSVSVNYRLILHVASTSATAWDLQLDNFVISNVLNAEAATQVPSVVLQAQAISNLVTDRMAVAWIDGANKWVPATSAYNADYWGLFGFATNIVGLTADIYVSGVLDGFSFGPFAGYNQYVDPVSAGGLTPLPAPFTDTYLIMGKAISATAIKIQPRPGVDLVTSKGGLLTNAGLNNGTGDEVLTVGANGNVLIANSAVAKGLQWAAAVVATAPFTYTLATRTLTIAVATNSVPGVLSAADHTTYSGYAATISLKAQLDAPVFTNDVNASTGNIKASTIGKGLQVKTGSNAKVGTAVLVGGTVTVSNTSVTANSRIFVTSNTDGGTPGWLRVSAKVNATSFTITSSSATDTSTVAWMIVESIP